jgi:hypothetical protein
MKILIVHPVMTFLGGGERLCCETIRALKALGHELTVLSESFDPTKVEAFFGFEGLFEGVKLSLYPRSVGPNALGTYSHLIHHIRGQRMAFRRMKDLSDSFDLLFSTQDAGYNPDTRIPVVQWGYMPKPSFFGVSYWCRSESAFTPTLRV